MLKALRIKMYEKPPKVSSLPKCVSLFPADRIDAHI